MPTTVLFVAGYWCGRKPYIEVSRLVAEAGFKTEIAALSSTGTLSPGNPSMKDDIARVRQHIESVFDRGEDVALVVHSAGGFIGGAAAIGLTKNERGDQACVLGAIIVSGAIWPEGFTSTPLPFAIEKDNGIYCMDPAHLFFNDLPELERVHWVAGLQSQPAQGWDDLIPFGPWASMPSTYVVCEKDNTIPPPLQEEMAARSKSKIVRLQAGHMAMVSMPNQLADLIKAEVSAIIGEKQS